MAAALSVAACMGLGALQVRIQGPRHVSRSQNRLQLKTQQLCRRRCAVTSCQLAGPQPPPVSTNAVSDVAEAVSDIADGVAGGVQEAKAAVAAVADVDMRQLRRYRTLLAPFFERETVLTPLADGVWALEQPAGLFGIDFGLRMVAVKLADGSLALINPVALTEECKQQLASLSSHISHLLILNTNIEHRYFACDYTSTYSNITISAPEPFLSSPPKELPRVNYALTNMPKELKDKFDVAVLKVDAFEECVLWHKESGSVLVGDVVMHVTERFARNGLFRSLLKIVGFYDRPGILPPLDKLMVQKPHMEQAQVAVRHMATWDITRWVPGHGEVVEDNAAELFKKEFAALL